MQEMLCALATTVEIMDMANKAEVEGVIAILDSLNVLDLFEKDPEVMDVLDLFEKVLEDAIHVIGILKMLDLLEIPQIVVVLCALNALDAQREGAIAVDPARGRPGQRSNAKGAPTGLMDTVSAVLSRLV